ncbi:glycosyltransferase family 2 protein [Bergeyella zoohelcum]|uniref:Putative glycosyltransferase n=1 Tax=Bergeyella zoohelcum TaxID=1015 RepID=A0A7Z9CGH6_9FLAO|nr:glycosyltransferase family 2 protein [Bergeyella zoohelcum]VDH05091.1 putative glycosyltransferase [Bergeyella zoohelcum]
MNSPKVSVLIPVYGVEDFVIKCLQSVVEQTYQHLEIIIINDCTRDRSIEYVTQFLQNHPTENRVKIINNENNKGLAATRNVGICHATGQYILHLDADDYLEINGIELLVQKALEQGVDIVFSNYNIIGPNEGNYKRTLQKAPKEDYLRKILLRQTSLNVWGNLYKKELFDGIRFLDGVNFGEDYTTLPKLVHTAETIDFIEESIYNYLKINTSSYTANVSHKSIEDMLQGYESIAHYFSLKENKWVDLVKESFYILKAHIIKSTRGNSNLLAFLKQKIARKKKKYPKVIGIQNNMILLLFDWCLPLCAFIVRKTILWKQEDKNFLKTKK